MTTDGPPGPSPEKARLSLDAPHLVLGICVTLVGLALTLDRLQILEAGRILRFWPVGLILFGASMVVQAFWPGAVGGGVGSQRRRGPLSPLLFFGVVLAVVMSVGQRAERQGSFARSASDANETVSLFSILGKDHRVSSASRFRGGEMTSVMGGTELDLREATMAPGEEAVIDVFAVMGGVVLRVPSGWTVDVQAVPLMGGVKDQRARNREAEATVPAAPRIVVRGLIMMGGLSIRS